MKGGHQQWLLRNGLTYFHLQLVICNALALLSNAVRNVAIKPSRPRRGRHYFPWSTSIHRRASASLILPRYACVVLRS